MDFSAYNKKRRLPQVDQLQPVYSSEAISMQEMCSFLDQTLMEKVSRHWYGLFFFEQQVEKFMQLQDMSTLAGQGAQFSESDW